MATTKIISGKDVRQGGVAVKTGGGVLQNYSQAEVFADPSAVPGAAVTAGRFLDGPWREEVLPASATDTHAPAANTAAVVTLAAQSGRRHEIGGVAASYSAAPTGGNLKIESPSGTVIFQQDIDIEGTFPFLFPESLRGALGGALIVTLAAGGASVSGKVSVFGRRLT